MRENIFYIFLVLIFERIKSGIVREINKEFLESKYSDYQYINGYRIPNSIMSFEEDTGIFGYELLKAFDENFNTYWISTTFQKGDFMNDVQVTFAKTVIIDRILYQAPTIFDYLVSGYPIELKVYIKLRNYDGSLSNDDSDYLFVDDFISEKTGNKVLFIFNEKIACDQIKLQWARIEEISEIRGEQALASEIIFLFPENIYINKTIYDIFPKNNYYKLDLNPEYNNIVKIEDLEQNMIDFLDILPQIQYIINRAKKIINGELKYEQRREFTTKQTAEINIINQYGDVTEYSRNVLLMSRGGTNRQPTGIFAFSNDIITIFVDSEDNDPLPSILFSQYIGLESDWLSPPFQLKKGINYLNVTEFSIEGIEVKLKKGGPIYIENPYEPNEQSQNVKLYFDDGILFPLFRINDNEKNFKIILNNYIKENQKKKTICYNVMELYSDRLIITWNATDAYKVYIKEGESPQENLKYWDKTIKKLYIFDGIQFEKNQPYYNIKNDYIILHMRYSTYSDKGAAAYAYIEHIGIFLKGNFYYDLLVSYQQMSSYLIHEIGHMIDVAPREYAERTNVVLEEYGQDYLFRDQYDKTNWKNIHKYISPDNIDNSLRYCKDLKDCKGFFINSGPYTYAQYTWWDIESFYPGYWGKLNNLYRYNITLISEMSKTEGMVFLSSLIIGIDLGYYFERFGLAFRENIPFNNSLTSTYYKKGMEDAIKQGKVKTGIYKKFWYADNDQYNFTLNKGTGCYKNNNNYTINIIEITKKNNYYNIALPKINCNGHLGFEIIENDVVIGFTTDLNFIDREEYPEGYNPRYKIAAYDRLLDYKESSYKSL